MTNTSLQKENRGNETIPCLRSGCSGIAPGTGHQPSLTAAMCVVVVLEPTHDAPEVPPVVVSIAKARERGKGNDGHG